MNIFAFKIIIILVLLNSYVFADKGAPPPEREPFTMIIRDTNAAGMVRTEKTIYKKASHFEGITTIHNKKGKLIYSKHEIYRNSRLVLIAEDGIVRKIVYGTTGCDFVVIEPSGDSIFFKLDPKKELELPFYMSVVGDRIIFFEHLKVPKASPKNKYEGIKFYLWDSHCKYTVGFW